MVVIHSNDPLHAVEELEQILENHSVSDRLNEIASLLTDQNASEFRVRAYHRAAETVRNLNRPLRNILAQEGIDGLIALPTIGISIANLIVQQLNSGKLQSCRIVRGREEECRRFYKQAKGSH